MKGVYTLFLKVTILLIAVVVLAGLLLFPPTEGRAAHLDLISIYANPFIIYIYIGSIPFFVSLYQAFKLLNFIDANKAFSQGAIDTLKIMKFASFILIGFIMLALFYIRFFVHGDDPAGPTVVGFFVSFAVAVIATAAAVIQRQLQNVVDLKREKGGKTLKKNTNW